MIQAITLLYPLDEFYERAGLLLPAIREIGGDEVPEPYRRLLVHSNDMTPTLEAYHGERIHLQIIARRHEDDVFTRQVVLTLNDSLRPVEYGAIAIHLREFPEEAREIILECRRPLGTILADYEIQHSSAPSAFIQVPSDALMNGALGLTGRHQLYGRKNALSTPDGRVLADVVEILPP